MMNNPPVIGGLSFILIVTILIIAQRKDAIGDLKRVRSVIPQHTENVMAFIPLVNGIKVTIEYSLGGEICVNVFFLHKGSTVGSVDLIAAVEHFTTWWNGIRGGLSSSLSIVRIKAQDWTTSTGAYVEETVFDTPGGVVTGAVLPNNAALTSTLLTGLAGRSYRGRTYAPGIPESAVTGNYVSNEYAAGFSSALMDLMDDLDTDGIPLVVASFQHLNAPRTTGVATPVINASTNVRLDTQRRRMPA